MADEDDKTEEPTGKRLADARAKGQVVSSQEVKHFCILLGGLIMVSYFLPPAMQNVISTLKRFLAMPDQVAPDAASIGDFIFSSIMQIALTLVIPFLFMAVMAITSGMIQTGPLYAPEAIKINWTKINPMTGFKRLVSMNSLIELGKSALKLTIVGAAGYTVMSNALSKADLFPGMSIPDLLTATKDLVIHMMAAVISVVAVIAALDYIQKRFAFNKSMRMSKEEVKDESKQAEGDPKIKARLRQLRMQKARQRMMASVPKADVVITNPTHYAVALEYKPETMSAPVVVAMGADLIALKIKELAEENKIAIVSNPPLARALFDNSDLDQPIPFEQYQAVAEVISFVFRLKGRKPR
jgi:flagellar biosynthetic protein FlhB